MNFSNLEKKDGKNPILSYLVNSKADIICLQEYNAAQNKKYLTEADIKKALKAYPYYSVRRQNRSDVQLACFSKYPILSVSPIDYESTYNGSVQYVLAVNNDTVTLINNHLESNKLTKEDRGMYEDMIKDPNAKKGQNRTSATGQKISGSVSHPRFAGRLRKQSHYRKQISDYYSVW